MNFIFFTILALTFFAIVYMLYKNYKMGRKFAGRASPAENIESKKTRLKPGFKLLSYQEALEISKQFIYDITRLVMQRFVPEDKNILLESGRKLFKLGMKYLHVVDVLSLSLQKQSEIGGPKTISAKKNVNGLIGK